MPYEIIKYTHLEHILKKILKISEIPHLDFCQHPGSKNESLLDFMLKNIETITLQQLYQNYKDATKEHLQIQIITTECLINLLLLNRIKNKFHAMPRIKETFELLVIGIIETKCFQSYDPHKHSIHRMNAINRDTDMHLQNLVFLELYAEPIWKQHNQPFTQYLNKLHNLRILILKSRVPNALLSNSTRYSKRNDCTFTADHIECLFLENYTISIINHFPNLKFLQIKITQQILSPIVINLSEYFHPNYKTLEYLVLANAIIENNKATYLYNSYMHKYSITFSLTNIKVQNISKTEHNLKISSSSSSTYQPPNNTNLAYQFLYNIDTRILYPFNKSTQTLKGHNIYNINIIINEENNTATLPIKSLTQNINHTCNQHNSQNLGYIFKINDEPFVSAVRPRTPLHYKKRILNNYDSFHNTHPRNDEPFVSAVRPRTPLHYKKRILNNYDSFHNTHPRNDEPLVSAVRPRAPLPYKKRILDNVTTTEITGVQCHK
ncbi:hypothetical protein [Ehrlichia muris]|uniref:Uncharacterized protein n=1 Tax=Ehrlichia muris AS145 TaxID=1423892 RepID=V9R880_9RICK|nr:hypothetical protein [Ehrlichia muris]AHC39049.1 hypothetical protein EMUR_01100 [Ehrlichia muris AS145]